MHAEVRATGPGECPRCGMALAGPLAGRETYDLRVEAEPRPPQPQRQAQLRFRVVETQSGSPVSRFEVVHEKLFHLFIVSRDLTFFAHQHPEPQPDGSFLYRGSFPAAGPYRLLCDFYPSGGLPQAVSRAVQVGEGAGQPASLSPDAQSKQARNLRVSLRTLPRELAASERTLLFFDLEPVDGLQRYLGALGHLLAVSEDATEMIHAHPAFDDPGRSVQFDLEFPRAGRYRLWVQFQRNGVVNTVAFTVAVVPAR